MAADKIINHELLNSQADSYAQFAEELNTKITNVDNAIVELVQAVHGEASTACTTQWENAKTAMLSYVPKLQDVSERLRQVATTAAQADTSASSGINIEVTQ